MNPLQVIKDELNPVAMRKLRTLINRMHEVEFARYQQSLAEYYEYRAKLRERYGISSRG